MMNTNEGTVLSVRGAVVDIAFTSLLPPIYGLLHAGKNNEIILEVHSQPDEASVRAIALTATGGLARGMNLTEQQFIPTSDEEQEKSRMLAKLKSGFIHRFAEWQHG